MNKSELIILKQLKEIDELKEYNMKLKDKVEQLQDRKDTLEIILDKIKEYIKENACYDKDIKQCCRDLLTDECDYVLKLLEEIK